MAKATQDYTKMMQDMMGAFPVDTTALEGAFKSTATLNEKLSGVALEAAEVSSAARVVKLFEIIEAPAI